MRPVVSAIQPAFRSPLLFRIAMVTWVAMVVLHGTYFRVRFEGESISIDWLIATQLICALAGFLEGWLLIGKSPMRLGLGAWLMFIYVGLASVSAFFSDYSKMVLGYAALLAGGAVLTVGLVRQAMSTGAISRLETIFLVTVGGCVVKDGMTAMIFPEMQEAYIGAETTFRLGMGVTGPNLLGLVAGLAFWLSFKDTQKRHCFFLWILRLFFLMVIILSRSRVAMICFAAGGLTRYWLIYGFSFWKGLNVRLGLLSFLPVTFALLALLLLFQVAPFPVLFEAFNRGESAERVMTLTRRTQIWPAVIKHTIGNPTAMLFGHGYGVSKLVLGDIFKGADFSPAHTHNALLEFLLAMGIPGAALFGGMLCYGSRWFTIFRQARQETLHRLAVNGLTAMAMIILSCLTEVFVVQKMNPVLMTMIFYFITLDQVVWLETANGLARQGGK